ncbi:Facilitated trehalose transporter Tret1 [Chamberlinius hualienensis]
MIISYPSPAFPDINHGNYGFKMTLEEMSWLASFAGLFAVPGSVILVPFMDRYGRKFALIMCLLPLAIGWLLTVVSYNIWTFGVGRAILGAVIGMVYSSIPMYLSEIAPKEVRGMLGSALAVFAYSGGLVANIVGTFVNWRWLAVVALGITAAGALTSFLMLETPRWLISNGFMEEAADVIKKTRGITNDEQLKNEVKDIATATKNVIRLGFVDGIVELVKPPLWKPFLITQILMIFQQFTGAAYIQSYAVTIFRQATSTLHTDNVILKNPHYQASLAISVFVIGSVVAAFIVDSLGRRLLLLVSGVGITLALAAIGAYYYILHFNTDYTVKNLFWLPLVCLMLYDFCYGVAFGGIPFLIVSEVFPIKVRAVANGMGSLNHNICFFIVVKVFPTIQSVSNYGLFWIYTGVALLSLVFIYFFVPETKGRSLEEIEMLWYAKKPNSAIDHNTEAVSHL